MARRSARRKAVSSPGWRYSKAIGVAALVLNLAAINYFAWSYYDNLSAVSRLGRLCPTIGSNDFDSIRAAQAIGRLDVVTLLFGVVAIILAIAALLGFQIFRREALDEARDAAEREARTEAARIARQKAAEVADAAVSKWLQEEALPQVLREVSLYLKTFDGERTIPEDAIAAMVAAAGADGKEGDGGQK